MTIDAPEALILDLLEWVDQRTRSYREVMDAWRTSCPRLPVWEDANELGLLTTNTVDGQAIVQLTTAGRAFLAQRRVH
jgi:D-3-phosphoglycerate dehydrogenase